MMLDRTRPALAVGLLLAACLPAMADGSPSYVPSALTVAPLNQQGGIAATGIPMHRRVRRRTPHRFVSLYPLLIPSLAIPKAIPPMPLPEAPQPSVAEQPTGLVSNSSAPERPIELSSPAFETTLLKLRQDRSSLTDSQVDYVETTFSEQVRMPLFRLWSGRLEFGAFDDERAMDNIFLGPQRAGGLANVSNLLMPAHQGKMTPIEEVSYGMMVSFHLRGHSEWGPHIHGWRCLGWAIGSGRGCRLD